MTNKIEDRTKNVMSAVCPDACTINRGDECEYPMLADNLRRRISSKEEKGNDKEHHPAQFARSNYQFRYAE